MHSQNLQHKGDEDPKIPWEDPRGPSSIPTSAGASLHPDFGGRHTEPAPSQRLRRSSAAEIIPSRLDFVQGTRSRGFFSSVETGLEKERIGIFQVLYRVRLILFYCKYK